MNADDAGAAAFIVCTTGEPAGQGARRPWADAVRSVGRGCRCERTQRTDVLSGMPGRARSGQSVCGCLNEIPPGCAVARHRDQRGMN